MTVHVQFFSRLKDIIGGTDLNLELADGATVSELIGELYQRFPPLAAWDASILVGAGVEFVPRDYVMKSGDQISIMPPVQGG